MNKTHALLLSLPKDSFYVYAYLRAAASEHAAAYTPYYIGKGTGFRAIRWHKGVGVPKDKTKVVILEANLTEIGALAIERRMIAWWGRKDLGTGILINKADGGDGIAGAVLSPETRARMSKAKRGVPLPQRTKEHGERIGNALRGRKTDWGTKPENRLAVSAALQGRVITKDWREKISQTLLGRAYNRFSCVVCKSEFGVNNLGSHHNSHFGLNKTRTTTSCSCLSCHQEVTINNLNQHFSKKHGQHTTI